MIERNKLGQFKQIYDIKSEILRELYIDKEKSINQIASIFNCTYTCIYRKMKKYNIPRRDLSTSIKLSGPNSGRFKKGLIKSSKAYKFPKGENHPMWKDNSTLKNYGKKGIRLSDSHKEKKWREQIYKRNNWTCQNCNQRGGELNSHHIKSWKDYPKLRYNIDNGITLCRECHMNLHYNRGDL